MVDAHGVLAFALAGVTVIDGTGEPAAENMVVVVRGDRIEDVFPARHGATPADVVPFDASGLYVLPGLIEAHCHVAGLIGAPAVDSESDAGLAGQVMPILPRYGITAVRDTGSPDTDLTWRPMKEGRAGWPRFFGSGPVIDGWPGGPFPGLWKTTDPDTARNWVRLLAAQGVDFIKTYVWISRDVLAAVVDEAHTLGLRVAAHVGLEITAAIAIDVGVDALEHIRIGAECVEPAHQEAIRALPYRTMDEIGDHRPWRWIDPDGPLVDDLISRMTEANTFLTPTLVYSQSILDPSGTLQIREAESNEDLRTLRRLLPSESFSTEYTDEDRLLGKREFESILRFVERSHEAGVRICAGTDSPSAGGVLPGIAYHNELELLVRCGFSPLKALHAATGRAAELLGVEDTVGTIAPGMLADILVLEDDPTSDIRHARSVRAVFMGGGQVVGPPFAGLARTSG